MAPARNPLSTPFLDAVFNREDLDRPYLPMLQDLPQLPVVFIQGLHRSGTTFLLNALHGLLPAASTRVCQIVFYRRLLHAHRQGETAEQERLVARYLEHHGVRDRGIDHVAVGPHSLDEYGFIYERLGVPRTATWLLRELRAKLSYLHPEARVLFLKDPVSFGSLVLLRAAIPGARFISVHRDPGKVLDSLFRARLFHLRGQLRDPYRALLLGRRPGLADRLRAYLMALPFRRSHLATLLASHLLGQIETYLRERPSLPEDSIIDVSFEHLLEDAPGQLGRLVDFLGVEPVRSLDSVRPAPRPVPPASPELRTAAGALRRQLDRLGYPPASPG